MSTGLKSLIHLELQGFRITKEQMEKQIERMNKVFDQGLSDDPEQVKASSIKMYPTHLSRVPDGSEEGQFYSVDIGGTKMRFFQLTLEKREMRSRSKYYNVPVSAMKGSAEELFSFMADCIKKGLRDHDMHEKEIAFFGLTFSFPCAQTALDSGTLVRWTKGYETKDCVGKDVVKLLKEQTDKIGLKIGKFILVNDTTGTLLCGAFQDKDTVVSMINGTGSNSCYIEDISKVKKWTGGCVESGKMIINTESGAYGENGEIDSMLTPYDREVDRASINPGQQIYEKIISGMYLGEIVRLVAVKVSDQPGFFEDGVPQKMTQPDTFSSQFLSKVYDQDEFRRRFYFSFDYSLSDSEVNVFHEICNAVSLRSARMAAISLAAIVRRVSNKRCVIAGDGSMFRLHPTFVTYLEEALKEIGVGGDKKVELVMASDGSGKGAALAACVANRIL